MNKKLYSPCLLALLCAHPAFGVFGLNKLFSRLSTDYEYIKMLWEPQYPEGKNSGILTSEQVLWKLKYGNLTDKEFEAFAMNRIQKRIDYYYARRAEAIKIDDEQKQKAIIAELPLFTKYCTNLKANNVVRTCSFHTDSNESAKKWFLANSSGAGLTWPSVTIIDMAFLLGTLLPKKIKPTNDSIKKLRKRYTNKEEKTVLTTAFERYQKPQDCIYTGKYVPSIIFLRRPTKLTTGIDFLHSLEHEITHVLEQFFDTYIVFKHIVFPSLKKTSQVPQKLYEELFETVIKPTTKSIKDIAVKITTINTIKDKSILKHTINDLEHEADFTATQHVDLKYALALHFDHFSNIYGRRDPQYPSYRKLYNKLCKDNRFDTWEKKQKEKEEKIFHNYDTYFFLAKKTGIMLRLTTDALITVGLFLAGKYMIKKTASYWRS